MNTKGFTLIELLAVIVILAIIALIATPIILNIIEDARVEANKRSIDNYGRAVKNAIASYQLKYKKAPTDLSDLTIEFEGDVECNLDESKLYEDGSIYLTGCKVNGTEVDYTYGEAKNVVVTPICDPVTVATLGNVPTKGEYNVGDEYTCNVDGTPRTFFILSKTGNNVSMIMNEDIGSSEWGLDMDVNGAGDEACENSRACGSSYSGPFTAMSTLHSSTKNWNVPNINMNYDDPTYGGIYTTGTTTIITNAAGVTKATFENLKARMPLYSEVKDLGTAPWLVVGTKETNESANYAVEEYDYTGYWTLTSPELSGVYYVSTTGVTRLGIIFAEYTPYENIRPVIELTTDYLNN